MKLFSVGKIALLIFFLTPFLFSAEVSVEIEDRSITAIDPISALIKVSHEKSETIETNSFRGDGKPLEVEPVREEVQNGQVVSIYRFQMNPQPEGTYFFPRITVRVDGEEVEALKTVYNVEHDPAEEGLLLRAFIFGEEPFYPGKRLRFVYKIYYRGDVQLTKEELPLLQGKGFLKVGEIQVEDSEESGYEVRTFTQQVEAVAPGEYTIDASVLEGILDGTQPVSSEVAPFTINILPFPKEVQPYTFNGALGEYTITSRLVSSPQVKVGEVLRLEIKVEGTGNLENVILPNINCQPGFSGFFEESDLPTVGVTKGDVKTFYVELRPTSSLVDIIPSIAFSFYNPEKGQYVSVFTKEIPIDVTPTELFFPPPQSEREQQESINWDTVTAKAPPPYNLKQSKTKDSPRINLWKLLWLVPILFFLLLMQNYARDWFLEKKEKLKKPKPSYYLNQAATYSVEEGKFYQNIKQAFLDDDREEVHTFIQELDSIHFGKEKKNKGEILKKAYKLL